LFSSFYIHTHFRGAQRSDCPIPSPTATPSATATPTSLVDVTSAPSSTPPWLFAIIVVAVILLGGVVGTFVWKRRQRSMVSKENDKSRDTFQGTETTVSNFGPGDAGTATIRKPELAVLQSAIVEMRDTNVADDVHGLGKSDVKVSFCFFSHKPPHFFSFN
jgi:hypothetical protein